MEVEKITLSVDMKLPQENLRNACKMIMYRLPRKRKKRWKASIAKRYGVKTSQVKSPKEYVWSFAQSVKEKIKIIEKGVKPPFVF